MLPRYKTPGKQVIDTLDRTVLIDSPLCLRTKLTVIDNTNGALQKLNRLAWSVVHSSIEYA